MLRDPERGPRGSVTDGTAASHTLTPAGRAPTAVVCPPRPRTAATRGGGGAKPSRTIEMMEEAEETPTQSVASNRKRHRGRAPFMEALFQEAEGGTSPAGPSGSPGSPTSKRAAGPLLVAFFAARPRWRAGAGPGAMCGTIRLRRSRHLQLRRQQPNRNLRRQRSRRRTVRRRAAVPDAGRENRGRIPETHGGGKHSLTLRCTVK